MPGALKYLREPLLHFLALGLALFALFELVSPGEPDPGSEVIVVDRDALLRFFQYRSKAFRPEAAAARLDALPGHERQRLIADYVREEALYRRALTLGMDADDYIIKRRLIQKMEFITSGVIGAGASAALSDGEVAAYFEANKDDYHVDPYLTFTHVFFDAERHGRGRAQAMAADELIRLNRERTVFADAPRHGDRFLYHTNYVERVPAFVASHFGEAMAQRLFALAADEQRWRGPFESPYGYHLVLLTATIAGRYPDLDEVAARVRDDALRALIRERSAAAVQAIVDGYDVRVVDPPPAAAELGDAGLALRAGGRR